MNAVEVLLYRLKAEPTLLPAAPPNAGAEHIEHRRLDEVHACWRCGGGARIALIAATELGSRWLDLCHGCYAWLQRGLDESEMEHE